MHDLVRGGGRCPSCGCRKVEHIDFPSEKFGDFCSRELEICVNCKAIWEPIDPRQIWDTSDPVCSFCEPCNNCAFRKGSPEQRDPKRWQEVMDGVSAGARFYCHKGVPIDPASEHGFRYPRSERECRLCRGYLNMLPKIWKERGGGDA